MFPKTTTTQAIQRNYRDIFDEVMEEKEPVVVMVHNQPQVVIVDFHQYDALQKRAMKPKSAAQLRFEKAEQKLAKLLIALDEKGKLEKYFVKRPGARL